MDLRIGIGKDSTKAVLRWPKLLQQKGYETIHVGKAHFDLEDQKAKSTWD